MIRNILCYAEESARRFPGKTAFADEETACTYDELIKSARAVGTRLGREVTPGKPIPVLMDKGVKAIYAFMGIVSAGCFYILLDPKLPTERLRSVLDTLQAEVLLTDPAYDKPRERLEFDGKVIMMEEALQTQEDAEYLDNVRKQSRDVDPLYFKMWSNYADHSKEAFLISDKTSGLSGRAGSNDSDLGGLCTVYHINIKRI